MRRKAADENLSIDKQIQKMKDVTFEQIQKKKETKLEWLECAICMEEYKNDSLLVVLKCHKSHVMHKDCFLKYLD